jgi:elongation factor Ts
MAQITAADVKSLRDKTGLPMMECKKALNEAGGDQEKAIELLRKAGAKTAEKQAGRATAAGRIAVYTDPDACVGTIVELRCETAPVATNEEFVALAADLAKQLAVGPGAQTPDELLAQPSPGKSGMTLKEQRDELYNRIRENFQFARLTRLEGTCAGYVHHTGGAGVILQYEGGPLELARDICMHIVAMRPGALSSDELDPTLIEKEREILTEAARGEGKPENIIAKMVEGRLRNFYAERCLLDQPFVKAEDGKTTVGKTAKQAGMKIIRFVHWELAKE